MSDGRIGCAASSSASDLPRARELLLQGPARVLTPSLRIVELLAQLVDQAARRLMRLNARSTGAMCSSCSSPPSGSRISSAAGSPFDADAIGERHERLHGAGNVGQRRRPDPRCAFSMRSPIVDFLVRLQQLALADVLQVDADEIDLLARAGGGRLFVVFDLAVVGGTGWSANASGSSSSSSRSGGDERLTFVGSSRSSTSRPNPCARWRQSRMCAWRDGSFHSISDFLRGPGRNARAEGWPFLPWHLWIARALPSRDRGRMAVVHLALAARPGSSVVEQRTFNARAAGSIPAPVTFFTVQLNRRRS